MNEVILNRCRACAELQECSTKMISLFGKNLHEMFARCTSLEVTSDDNLPSHICIECFELLSNFDKFRQKCAKSEAYFREQIVIEIIKVEPLDVIKNEENESNREIKSEFYKFETHDDSIAQSDSQSKVRSFAAQHDIIPSLDSDDSNPLDGARYICDYCGKGFLQKSHIGSHMIKHKKEMEKSEKRIVTKTFTCTVEQCSKVFETRKLLNDHRLKVHKIKAERIVATEIEKKQKLRCPKCPKWFHVQHILDGHIRSKHEGLKAYKCTQCEKGFNRYGAYTHHLRFSHNVPLTDTKLFRCEYDGCDRVYGLMDSLKAHINRHHLCIIPERRDQKLICDQCGRSFTDGHSLKKHIYSHTGTLPFPCKICPKAFLTNHQLKMHTMRHLNIKPFECPTCGARKTTNKELQAHLNFHTKAISYPCKECDRVFTSYGAISRHVRIHHRNHKPYVCPHCEKTFAKAETMKNHVMTHTGEKPFACPICGHRFIQAVAMKTHMKTHTKK